MRQILPRVAPCLRWSAALLLLLAGAQGLLRTARAAGAALPPVAGQWVYPVGNPSIAPTYADGNANGYSITQGFNTSCDPAAGQGHYYAGYYFCGHTGVDLSANGSYGGVVRAAAAGMVVFAGADGSYGNMVRIEHLLPDGQVIYSQYEHLGYNTVGVWYGEFVACGQQIGAVGDSGFAQGAHLHFEIKDSNSDGPGYTFGNTALLAGFYDPLSFLGWHIPVPTPPPAVATAVTAVLPSRQPAHRALPHPLADREGADLLQRFLHQYRYFVTVETPALRLRAGPGLRQRQVGVVMKHTKLALLSVSGPWLHVALPESVTGWVYSSLVKGAIPASLAPPGTRHRPGGVALGGGLGRSLQLPARSKARVVQQAHKQAPLDIRRLGPLARVLVDGVRVRSGPHLQDDVLFLASRGSMVAVRGSVAGWSRVTFTNRATGWMTDDYLLLPRVAQARQQRSAPRSRPRGQPQAQHRHDLRRLGPLARVLVDGVRVRSGAHLHDGVLFLANRGSMVAVRAIRVSWVQVTFTNGATGWILGHYLLLPRGAAPPRRVVPSARGTRLPVAGRRPDPPAPASPATIKRAAFSTRPAADAPAPAATYYTWATTLYVRAAPRLGSAVVALAGENTPVHLLGTHVSWSHLRLPDGTEGWALSHYVQDHRKIYASPQGAGGPAATP